MSEFNPLSCSQSQLRTLPIASWNQNIQQTANWPDPYYWQELTVLEQYAILESLALTIQVSLHCRAVLRRMQEENPSSHQSRRSSLARPKVRERISGHKIAEKRQNHN